MAGTGWLKTAAALTALAVASAAIAAPGQSLAGAQTGARPVAAPVVQPKVTPEAPVAGNPDFAPDKASTDVAPVPALPPAMWSVVDAQDLLMAIQQVGREGLNPTDYDPAGLQAALANGDPMALSAAATARFNQLSRDLALGHVRRPARVDWMIVDNDLNDEKQDALLRSALAAHDVGAALQGLLPTHPQYAALKAALLATPATDTARADRIRLNMDRWRWLPRELGEKYIIVNVPSYHATLVENGVNRWKNRAIAGKLSTPTPQLNATAVGVILNPWWEVPKSIEKEAAGKRGFVPAKGPNGEILRWRQPPGPTNALGQVKFVMPNSKAIYLHDTNARSRFNDKTRALSHGCIRTQHILDLATTLLEDDGGKWDDAKVKATLASGKSVQANFVKPLPVYIVYFSSAALNDGRIVDYTDVYSRDTAALRALKSKDGGVSVKAATAPAAKSGS